MTRATAERELRSPRGISPHPADAAGRPMAAVEPITGRCACGGGCPSCLSAAGIQPSLLVGSLDDPEEREADAVADAATGHDDAHAITDGHVGQQAHGRASLAKGGGAPASVASVLAGGGRALDPVVRAEMEARLGADFSDVRLHTGPQAAASAAAIGAHAYTHGSDVVLGAGTESVATPAGRRTLVHELTHVAQQAGGPQVVRRQSMDPRHARGHGGEQDMGFVHYSQEDGWILFQGPSGAGGHGTTQSGFDAVAYNTRTGEIHLVDNKSLARPGNVGSATAIDPSRNLAKNVDDLIVRVEAAKDVPGRIRLLGRLRALRDALVAGKAPPSDVKLVVTGMGGRSTGVTPRLQGEGVEFRDPPSKPPINATPKATSAPKTPVPKTTSTPTPVEKPVPIPTQTPTQVVKPAPTITPVEPEMIPVPGGKLPMPTTTTPIAEPPVVAPPVRPTGRWSAGLKAGGKALLVALLFAGLDYWVHKRLQADLEESIDKAHKGAMPWANRLKRDDPTRPVYMQVTVEAKEYSTYVLFAGWMPDAPVLHMISMAMVRDPIDPPQVTEIDNRLDIFHPGVTTRVVYTELMVE